jgi:N-acyl-phosphatidylethanolamine-hydrolysing phospholipase D
MSSEKPHHGRRGFRNNYPHDRHGLRDFLTFLWGFQRRAWQRVRFPAARNDPAFLRRNREQPTLTWVGHSTFLLQVGGLNVLTDPHFTSRASPLAFAGPARLAPPGMALADLPPLDLVLISHNHYDHLDAGSVRALARAHPEALFVVPLGLQGWLQRRGVQRSAELDWWQAANGRGFRVTATPVQHFSGRGASDRNRTLWCGFMLEVGAGVHAKAPRTIGGPAPAAAFAPGGPPRKIFFAGDTGYSKDFADIGAKFAPVDLALLPIGAYDPRWFMRAMHVNPEEAVRIHQDLGSRQSVAMHWGTFRLTEEPVDEPPRQLRHALAAAQIPAERFWVMQHGETRTLDALAEVKQQLAAGG